MNDRETEIFKALMARYKDQWDRNSQTRTNYDNDLEAYVGYRNASAYPLAYNESFNRILPIIYTILSRFMDQLYQSGNVISVRPRKSKDVQSAGLVEGVLNYQMESLNECDMQGGSYLMMYKWLFNALTFGKGIVKCYWRKEERISPKRMIVPVPKFDRVGNLQGWDTIDNVVMEPQMVYNGPYIEVLHNKTFIPHPEYRSIQSMPAVFIVYKKPIDHIRKMVERGVYKQESFSELGWYSSSGAGTEPRDSNEAFVKSLDIEGYLSAEQLRDDYISPEVDIIEAYTRCIIEDAPYEVGSGLQIKGKEEECIAHIGNYHTLLSLQRNRYGYRPLFDIGAYLQPELYWDIGLVRLTRGIQQQVDNIANMRMQDIAIRLSQMLRVDPDSDVDPESLVWRPWGLFAARPGEVEPLVVPDVNIQTFHTHQQFLEHSIQDLMGMYDYNMGQTPQRQERVGVVYGIQAMGEARAKLLLMSMDYMGIRPLLKYMMLLNTFHLENGFQFRIAQGNQNSFQQIFSGDIHPDYDFAARYTSMEPALGKQARFQQLISLSQIMLQNPYINQFQWWRTILELGDIREAEFMLKSEQQLQQEKMVQQQAQQMQMKSIMDMQQKQKQSEVQGKIVQSQQDFKEDRALAAQQFEYDQALKMIEMDMQRENRKSK